MFCHRLGNRYARLASQFDRPGDLVVDLLEKAERYGFDFWQMFGATEQCLMIRIAAGLYGAPTRRHWRLRLPP